MDLAAVKLVLTPPVKRESIIELMSSGDTLPPHVKVLAYAYLQGMSQSQIEDLADKTRRALPMLEAKNWAGLRQVCQSYNMPGPFIDLILRVVSNGQAS